MKIRTKLLLLETKKSNLFEDKILEEDFTSNIDLSNLSSIQQKLLVETALYVFIQDENQILTSIYPTIPSSCDNLLLKRKIPCVIISDCNNYEEEKIKEFFYLIHPTIQYSIATTEYQSIYTRYQKMKLIFKSKLITKEKLASFIKRDKSVFSKKKS